MSGSETSSPNSAVRSSGTGYAARIEQEKGHRAKSRSLKPLAKLWPFVAKYPGQLLAFLAFLILSAGFSLMVPAMLKLIVDCGFGEDVTEIAYCENFTLTGTSSLDGYFLIAICFALLFSLFGALRYFFITRLGQRVIADIRIAVFNHLTTLSPAYFERLHTGEVLSRLTTDTTLIETVMTGSISFALRSLATITGSIILMFIVSWKLALMVLGIVPIIVLPLVIAGKKIRSLSRDGQDRLADASGRAGEALGAIQTVQAYTQEPQERALFQSSIEASFDAHKKRILTQGLLTIAMFALTLTGIIGVLWFGARSVAAGSMTGGDITAFTGYAFFAVSGMSALTETYTNLMRAAGASDRIVEILGSRSDIQISDNASAISEARGNIEFEDVKFTYPSRPDMPALCGVTFSVKPGETVALVGPSGAGKSTVFQALLRFYDIDGGRVKIDGIDIRDLDPLNLREQIAVVQQNTPLFSGTAHDNIGYGIDKPSDMAITQAAKAAYADAFIRALPDGYDTHLGERSATLSGGQRQRLAIARAILRNAPILLLDEATSALDSESERAVQKAFESMSEDRTTLVIAHRLSTVLKADKILVFDEGRIIESGTHEELMDKDGLYAHLARIQFDQTAKLNDVRPE